MQELIDKVQELVAFELERANTIHPPKFNSYHEAYAVILEELEEAKDELEYTDFHLGNMWEHVKDDETEDVYSSLTSIETTAIRAAAEAIQVAAMAQKARM